MLCHLIISPSDCLALKQMILVLQNEDVYQSITNGGMDPLPRSSAMYVTVHFQENGFCCLVTTMKVIVMYVQFRQPLLIVTLCVLFAGCVSPGMCMSWL